MNNTDDLLQQLLRMVGAIRAGQEEMKVDIQEIKDEQQEMKKEMLTFKDEQQEMKKEMLTFKVEQQELKKEMLTFKAEQQEMKKETLSMNAQLHGMNERLEQHHEEMIRGFKFLRADQDFIWEKTVRNEREIENIKRQ